jgi:hypothetical protein
MTFFHIALIRATFLSSIVAGFLFAFAVVVMPGIRSLDDGKTFCASLASGLLVVLLLRV